MNKRLLIALIMGAILGVVCIIGASLRSSETLETYYLFAFWFNRVLIGLVIGLAALKGSRLKRVLIASGLGLLISFAFFASTNFNDLIGFLVGAVYGALIELALLMALD